MAQGKRALPIPVISGISVPAEQLAVARKAQLHELADRPNPVEPRELFPLGAAARVVTDRYFVDPVSKPQHPRGDVRFDLEAVPFKVEAAPEIGS